MTLSSPDPDEQAQALLARMSIEERLAMMDGDLPLYPGLVELGLRDYYHRRPFPAGRNRRLGIDGIRFVDGPRGIVLHGGATTFPVTMARGATFDPALEERIGDAIGKELRSHGGNLFGGVCINVLRHPAWGRAQETYGEDPFHLGAMGSGLVRGVQRHAMACIKHFAANSMENARFHVDVTMRPRVLHEVYLPHFKTCVDAGAAAVMSAYNSVNGEWCGQNAALLTDVLRTRWGFDGFVLTDFVFGLRDAEHGVRAGQDLEMPFRFVFHDKLQDAVARGVVPIARIDQSVVRILRKLLAVPPRSYPRSVRACPEHLSLARKTAVDSIVLLKNRGALPIVDSERIAVFGKLAAVPNLGDHGSSDGRPEYVVTPLQGLRARFDDRVAYHDGTDPQTTRELAAASDAAIVIVGYTAAEEGESIAPPSLEGFFHLFPPPPAWRRLGKKPWFRRSWSSGTRHLASWVLKALRWRLEQKGGSFGVGGDRQSLRLPAEDVALIRRVAAANPRTIVAVMAGSAVLMSEWDEDVAGILMLWYPGMEGGHALADIVSGDANPGGRLPFSVPEVESHLPPFDATARHVTYDMWHGYTKLARDGHEARYPFGFGLSYSDVRYSRIGIEEAELAPSDVMRVAVDIENVSTRACAEVVQLYVTVVRSRVERAPRKLIAFQKVTLAPAEKQTVDLTVPIERLAFFDEDVDDFVVEPTVYVVTAARHAGAEGLTTTVRVRSPR